MDISQDNQFPTSDPIVMAALKAFQACQSHDGKIRELASKCHEFFVGGEKQWSDTVLSSYRAQKRPDLTFNGLAQYVYNVLNEQLQNPSEIQVMPYTDGAEEEIAQVYQDIIRKIVTSKRSQFAINHAHRDHIVGGFGYFRICTEYVSDRNFNQCVYLEPIESCFSVYFDPGASFPDYRDAKYCIIFHDMPLDEFRAQYPDSRTMGIAGIDGNENEWLQKDSVRIMEYICCDDKKRTLVQLSDGRSVFAEEMQPGEVAVNSREITEGTVTCHKMTAYEQLEKPEVWVGKHIPIIPVLGEQIIVNGERYLKGLLHDALDPQIALNFMQNEQLLNISTAAKTPWLIAEGQIENAEQMWEEANRKAWAFLPYKAYDENGNPYPQPIRNNTEPPVQAVQMAINSQNNSLNQSMGIYPNALGQQQGLDESARAVIERKKQTAYGNFRFTSELNSALLWLGEQLIEIIPKVYDAPQIMQLEGMDKKQYKAAVFNSETQGQMMHDQRLMEGIKGVFDLSAGTYNVSVSTGPGYETQRAECQAFFAAFAQAVPELVPVFADLWARTMDFPEKDELADRLQMALPPNVAAQMGKSGDPKAQMPAMQAQLQQSQQMIMHLSQMVQQLTAEKQSKMTEIHGRAMIDSQKNQTQERIARMKNATDLAIQASEAHQAGSTSILDHEIARIHKNMDMDHEAHLAIFNKPPVMPDEPQAQQ